MSIVTAALALFALHKKTMAYHDELINTYKASIGLLFDYALRPVFYGVNALAYRYIGPDYFSLVLAAGFSFVLTAMAIHRTVLQATGSWASFLAPVLFVSYIHTYQDGIRAMPHIHMAALMALTLMCYFASRNPTAPTWKTAASASLCGVFACLCLLSHGTALAFCAGLFAVLTGHLLLGFLKTDNGYRWKWTPLYTLAGFTGALIAADRLFSRSTGRSYFVWQINTLSPASGKIHDPAFEKYHQAFPYYGVWLFSEYKWLFLVAGTLLLVWVVLTVKRFHKAGFRISLPSFVAHPFAPCALMTAISLVMISTVSWKFPRVLIGYAPLYALTIAFFVVGLGNGFSKRFAARTFHCAVVALLALAAHNLWGQIRWMDTQSQKYAWKYSTPYKIVQALPGNQWGYIGPSDEGVSAFRTWARFPVSNQGTLTDLRSSAEAFDGTSLCELAEQWEAKGIRNILVSAQTAPAETVEVRSLLRSLNGARIYTWRGLLEIWTLDFFIRADYAIPAFLTGLRRNTRIGTLSESPMAALQNSLIRRHGLRPVPTRLDPARPQRFPARLQSSRVSHVLVHESAFEALSQLPSPEGSLQLAAESPLCSFCPDSFRLYRVHE